MGVESARAVIAETSRTGIAIREDTDTEFWQRAGLYKAKIKRVSLADCFCMALSERLSAEIVTADRHEFEAVEKGLSPEMIQDLAGSLTYGPVILTLPRFSTTSSFSLNDTL
ncbi:MAG: hypothetical protein NTU88_15195, partial [Armatimonadetes bacterium]|nr:hypothetical protein [Armatimonadota bacterium]